MIFRLRKKAFARLEPYMIQVLKKKYVNYDEKIRKIFNNINLYFNLLRQSFGDLDEARTAELQLLDLRQKGSVSEYLTRFTQYGAKIA
jgi:hypothetical protein